MNQDCGTRYVLRSRGVGRVRAIGVLAVAATMFGLVGCGEKEVLPQLGMVSGAITVNGVPFPDLKVTFEPEGQGGSKSLVGSASTAITDSQGRFELQYEGSGEKGAVVGTHVVRVESAAGGGPAGGANATAILMIPESYNAKSALRAEVAAGTNPPVKFEIQVPK